MGTDGWSTDLGTLQAALSTWLTLCDIGIFAKLAWGVGQFLDRLAMDRREVRRVAKWAENLIFE